MKPPTIAVVLAAGQSRRMGQINKLLLPHNGVPLVRLSVERFMVAGLKRIFLVTGYQGDLVQSSLNDLPVTVLKNPQWARGMGTSIACAAINCPPDIPLCICPADLPFLKTETIRSLHEAFLAQPTLKPLQPFHENKPGHPVFFPPNAVPLLRQLDADQGAQSILKKMECVQLPCKDPGITTDWDDPESLSSGLNPPFPAQRQ